MEKWLQDRDLLDKEDLDPASLERRYTVFSSMDIGEDCPPEARLDFMKSLLPV